LLRLTEIMLFLAPFAALIAWWALAARGGPSPRLLAMVAAGALLVAAGLFWFASTQRLAPGEHYIPAQLENGRIVPGHGERQ
jgi:hypothetical protein